VEIPFEWDGGSGDDEVYVYAYCPEAEEGVLSASAWRRSGSAQLKLPDRWQGKVIHFYGFAVDEKGQASATVYIGRMETEAVEPRRDNNFSTTLPVLQANYANEVFRDNYNLGFLGVTEPIAELELERRLVEKIKLFLLELGKGFTFIGNQHVLEYNGKESKVDMLFFHRGLRCLVAIDLKIGAFKPEYAGKMNYYLSLLDRIERGEDENRSIGIILCAEKDHVDVELALEDMGKPISVAEYQLILPKQELEKVVKDEIAIYERDRQQSLSSPTEDEFN
jgi:predicted nuclease of restriction endonuclease-like (RecB) superfamily